MRQSTRHLEMEIHLRPARPERQTESKRPLHQLNRVYCITVLCCWLSVTSPPVLGWRPIRVHSAAKVQESKMMSRFGLDVRGGASTSLNRSRTELDDYLHRVLDQKQVQKDEVSQEINQQQHKSTGTEVSSYNSALADGVEVDEKENTADDNDNLDSTYLNEVADNNRHHGEMERMNSPQNQQMQSSQVQQRQSPAPKMLEQPGASGQQHTEQSSERQQQQTQDSMKQSSQPSEVAEEPPKPEDPRIMHLIRILFLSYYASLGALMPYLPVYYHSLGHGGQIIGMLGAVKPLTTFLVAPFWGLVADQAQAPFIILKVTFAVSLIGQLLVVARNGHRYIMFMVFLTALFNAPVKSLIDGIVMDHINDRSQYGRLRLWGQMGFGLGSSGVGILLSRSKEVYSSTATSIPQNMVDSIAKLPLGIQKLIAFGDKFWQCITGYRLLFLTHAALSVPTWIAIKAFQRLDKEAQDAKTAVAKSTKKGKDKDKEATGGARIMDGLGLLLNNADALIFFGLIFVVGVSSGIIENFAYVRIREVGGTGKDMGLSRLVSSIAGAPMFWFSGPLTELLGADRVLVLSLLSYVARFAIYALMRHPLHGLPAEALRGITFAAFWSTGTVYAHRISPPGLHATMLMFLNAMYGGLGQSLGAIIGGKLQSKVGTVKTFVYSAGADLCFVGLVFAYLSLRRESSFRNPTPIARKTTP